MSAPPPVSRDFFGISVAIVTQHEPPIFHNPFQERPAIGQAEPRFSIAGATRSAVGSGSRSHGVKRPLQGPEFTACSFCGPHEVLHAGKVCLPESPTSWPWMPVSMSILLVQVAQFICDLRTAERTDGMTSVDANIRMLATVSRLNAHFWIDMSFVSAAILGGTPCFVAWQLRPCRQPHEVSPSPMSVLLV